MDSLGEHLILGFEGKFLPEWLISIDEHYSLGGVILFARNIESPAQLRVLCAQVHNLSSRPLIFIDQEGGRVARMTSAKGFENLVSEYEFAQLSEEQKMAMLEAVYKEMSEIGIDFNLAPVIDTHNANNPNIGALNRAYSNDPGNITQKMTSAKGFENLVSEYEFAQLSEEQKMAMLEAVYKEMSEIGIDFNLAPVIDTHNANNPNIGALNRAYSNDPGNITQNVHLTSNIAEKFGVKLCLKHFPGIGNALHDSHEEIMRMPYVKDDEMNLFFDLAPIIPGNSVMISHAVVENIDSLNPASASKKIIDLLRFHDPDALVISDSLEMEGFRKFYNQECNSDEAIISMVSKSLLAGNDMICLGRGFKGQEKIGEENFFFTKNLGNYLIQNSSLEEMAQLNLSVERIKSRKT